ncbi:ATP-dependent zinc metalloprotease FtsH [Mucilaginibacter rubeus]|uniref:ATP-dependent zinc metalloprotease FtsH n=1 Tax=Mucilaginibacter rubeus TaxID=2027860 RepID=A0AAE6JBU7_9SPHI|nr:MULTISPECIES: ATP-dependent zinc metalloprotease FtsH [Mucilaginibacter]QEM02566.1 ATP-dependent zinc metalloprotease FtsH [Mucilaginibacter rubeus]QEM15185.1 ATP-dependent zinc metalloprotease FtsH [Mucilaginibacter gossypii]QTE42091.1 ATP-dependent zinc metalloprotease FtsH [Mucilaginibacter rubeus]QTE48692.1 ATP-dependent zinc metalloprotease FtsH [Mucilaginibacter rubeus]QTE60078.1 ATP-dependent zinc metalloprotease FtsH [Mucilaginibacter rubeus]
MKNDQPAKPKKSVERKIKPAFSWVWVYVIILLYVILSPVWSGSYNVKETTWQQFSTTILNRNAVERLEVVNKEKVNVYLKSAFAKDTAFKEVFTPAFGKGINAGPHYSFTIGSVEVFERNMEEAEKFFAANEKVPVSYIYQRNWLMNILGWLAPFILLMVIWNFMMRRSGGGMAGGSASSIFNFGRSTATLIEKESGTVTFADVAGLDEAKVEVLEIVDFLKKPDSFTKLGAKIPKGVILVGPPGTGKTLLAKAVAGEAQVPFFSISGAAFVEMFVGVGASRVRDLFQQAKEKAPCIIFIDEIDAIGQSRGRGAFSGGANDERESTLNQLLTEMDGFGTNTGVIVLAATNRADMLDPALVRPGRFDRHIYLELPNMNERAAIFKVHVQGLIMAEGIDLRALAGQTPGFSGADIANICNEAALIAARRKAAKIEKEDFMDAIDRIVAGLEKKSKIISPEEKKIIAFHEAGHAVISWLLRNVDPLVKVSIIPRGQSLGAAWYLPEEKQLRSETAFKEHLCATLGGRAAEEIIFGEISSGALDDLEKVTKEAYTMVVYYGFNNVLGNVSYYDSTGQRDLTIQKPFSEATGELIDQEIRKLVARAYEGAKTILEENKASLEKVAGLLLKKEVIYKDDLENILGKRGPGFPAIDLKVKALA